MAHVEWFAAPITAWSVGAYSLTSRWDEPICKFYEGGGYDILGMIRRSSAEDNEQFDLERLVLENAERLYGR